MDNSRKRIRLLLTSTGSFVGKNILDVLDYSGFNRRDLVEVVGTNSLADSPNNFRCDRCYLVPDTVDPSFDQSIRSIIESEKPDMIFCGRDEDTARLAEVLEKNYLPETRTPYGTAQSLHIGLNKWETWKFSVRNVLPFAATFVPYKSGGHNEFRRFTEDVGFPLIAKPVVGFASKGVFFIQTVKEAMKLFSEETVFQEYLGDPLSLTNYFKQFRGPVPLFSHAPQVTLRSCATVVGPQGQMAPIIILENQHQNGYTISCKRVIDAEMEAITKTYAKAYYKEGGTGPLSIQFKQDRHGIWKAIEMNLRSNGNTFVRFLLGQDELGLIFNWFLPGHFFPTSKKRVVNVSDRIEKLLQAHIVHQKDVKNLKIAGAWIQK